MTTRRDFLGNAAGALAGVAFCGCNMFDAPRTLAAEVGADRIMMGTDYPFPWNSTSVDHILKTSGLSDTDKANMLGDTASRLLGIKEG